MAETVISGIEFSITADTSSAINSIDQLSRALKRLQGITAKGGIGLTSISSELSAFSKSISKMRGIESIERLSNALKGISSFSNAANRLSENPEAIGMLADNLERISYIDFSNLATAADAITDIVNAAAPANTGFSDIASGAASATHSANRLSGALKSITGTLGKGLMSAGRGFFSLLKFSAPTKEVQAFGNALGGLVGRFKRLLIMRTFRAMIRAVVQAFKDGINNLYAWSNAIGGEFAQSMDRCSSALLYFKNSLGALAAPIVNALAPALDFVVDKIVDFINMLNQLIAKLTGATYWIRATRQATSYGDAMSDAISGAGSAAKEALRYLAPFDEINKFPEDNGSSGGGGGGSGGGGSGQGNVFEEMVSFDNAVSDFADMIREAWEKADFTEVGQVVAEKLRDTLDSIEWGPIQETCNRIAQSIATFINGFVETPGIWESIGSTLGNVLNTAVGSWNTFFDTTHWESIGSGLGTMLNDAISTIDAYELGRALTQKISALLDAASGFIQTFDFGAFSAAVSEALQGAIDNLSTSIANFDWRGLGQGIQDLFTNFDWSGTASSFLNGVGNLVIGIGDAVSGALEGVDWIALPGQIIDEIKTAVGDTDWSGVPAAIAEAIGAVLGALLGLAAGIGEQIVLGIADFFTNIGEWKQELEDSGKSIWDGIGEGIKNALTNIGAWIKENILDPFVTGFKNTFGIHSPSKEMEGPGKDVGEGILSGIKSAFNNIKNWVQTNILDKIQNAIDNGKQLVASVGAKLEEVAGDVGDFISNSVTVSVSLAKRGWTTISAFVGTLVNTFVTLTKSGWTTISNYVGTWVTTFVGLAKSGWSSISSFVGTWVTTSIGLARYGWSSISSFVGTWVTTYVGLSKSGWTSITSYVGSWVGVFIGLIKSGWSSITSFVGSWVTVNIGVVKGWIGSLADVLGISTIWASLKLTVPKIGVNWGSFYWGKTRISYPTGFYTYYARGGIMDGATLFGMGADGQRYIGGEAGAEAILPLENHTEWMDTFADRVIERMSGENSNTTIQLVVDGKVLAETNTNIWRQQARAGQYPLAGIV